MLRCVLAGDVILSCNGKPASRKGVMYDAIGPVYVPGKEVDLVISRPSAGLGGWKTRSLSVSPVPVSV